MCPGLGGLWGILLQGILGNTATRYYGEYCYKVLWGNLLQGILGNTATRYIREYCYTVLYWEYCCKVLSVALITDVYL